MLFYDNFERLCKKRGTTPSGAVVAIGKNKTTAGNWKRNDTIPSEDILVQLAAFLDCKVSDFFKDENERDYHEELVAYERIRDEAGIQLDEFEIAILDFYNSLETKEKAAFMQMIYERADRIGIEL